MIYAKLECVKKETRSDNVSADLIKANLLARNKLDSTVFLGNLNIFFVIKIVENNE